MGISKKIRIALASLILAVMFVTPAVATDVSDLEAAIGECANNRAIAHEMAECARALGYSEDHVIITTASNRWWEEYYKQIELEEEIDRLNTITANDINNDISNDINDDIYNCTVPDDKYADYPYASQVWEFLKNDMGLNDYVAAGILGNMMAECGGQTLALQPFIYTSGYYGLCMWYIDYTPQVAWQDVAGQLEVLKDTCKRNMEYFGGNYDYFCSLTNEVDAAWYFTEYYERGYWASIRGTNATTALKYFAG